MEDGTTLYLKEVRTGRKRLAAVTMRRYPATIDADKVIAGLDPNVHRKNPAPLGEDGLKIIDTSGKSRASLEGMARELDEADQALADAKAAANCVNGGGGIP